MSYCRNCGTQLIDGAKFCQKCGCSVTSENTGYTQRKQEFAGKLYKCPHCGEVLKSFELNCPACGYELRGARASSVVKEFALKLEVIESRREYEKPRGLFAAAEAQQRVSKTDEQKISLIKSFSVPNTKEDIPTLQEFIGYCLIPSNKGQRMMVIKGNGGEGKSQIGAVLSTIFGTNMKDGSIGKISENRFARADLEHILLCVDDDMRMEALRQTNYVKSIVTAQGKMDLERKGKQSYQGWMFARLLAFSNGDLQALYDRSDGFYRRQLVLTTKEKPVDRADDPDLAEKMKGEAEGIFLWAFEGLHRLVANNFKFTESDRIRANREAVKRDNNNIFDFMDSEGYIRRKADASISSKDFYAVYRLWCEENSLAPLKSRSFSDAMVANAKEFDLEHCNNITNSAGRRVWGFMGVEAVARPNINGFYDVSPCTYVPEEWRD